MLWILGPRCARPFVAERSDSTVRHKVLLQFYVGHTYGYARSLYKGCIRVGVGRLKDETEPLTLSVGEQQATRLLTSPLVFSSHIELERDGQTSFGSGLAHVVCCQGQRTCSPAGGGVHRTVARMPMGRLY